MSKACVSHVYVRKACVSKVCVSKVCVRKVCMIKVCVRTKRGIISDITFGLNITRSERSETK